MSVKRLSTVLALVFSDSNSLSVTDFTSESICSWVLGGGGGGGKNAKAVDAGASPGAGERKSHRMP